MQSTLTYRVCRLAIYISGLSISAQYGSRCATRVAEVWVEYPRLLAGLGSWFPDARACLDYLDWLRWPGSFRCPLCTVSFARADPAPRASARIERDDPLQAAQARTVTRCTPRGKSSPPKRPGARCFGLRIGEGVTRCVPRNLLFLAGTHRITQLTAVDSAYGGRLVVSSWAAFLQVPTAPSFKPIPNTAFRTTVVDVH